MPNNEGIRKQIFFVAHDMPYSVYTGATKMYQGLKEHFWWNKMKKDVVEYVSKCLTCQNVKTGHRHSASELKLIELLEWK